MILVNDKQVEFTKFPDGTTSFRYNPFGSNDTHLQYHMEV